MNTLFETVVPGSNARSRAVIVVAGAVVAGVAALAVAVAPAGGLEPAGRSGTTHPVDDAVLLHRFVPSYRFDRHEAFFPVSPAALASGRAARPGLANRLLDGSGRVLADRALTLAALGARYPASIAHGRGARSTDVLDASDDYVLAASRLRREPRVVYGRVVHAAGGRSWLQYWSFYFFNGEDMGIVSNGLHEGDWELVQVALGPGDRPEAAVLSQHESGERCAWRSLERASDGRPVVYVANGSHAVYSRPGRHRRPGIDPDDVAGGDGPVVRPSVEAISAKRPRWLRWPGRWGGSAGGPLPGEHASPYGPPFQGARWSDPSAFAAAGRSCRAAPRALPLWIWVMPAMLSPLLIVVGARRRRSGRLARTR